MKLMIVVLLAVNLMVSADVTSDDKVAKGKREAPMAEPSTDYLPPRLEAPYATFQPITVGTSAAPQPSYFQQTTFNQQPSFNDQSSFNQRPSFNQQSSFDQPPAGSPAPAPAYEYSRFAGVIPLQGVDNNELGNGINQESYNANPGPPYYNNIYGVSGAYTEGNNYGGASSYGSFIKYGEGNQVRTNYGSYNGLGQSLNVYGGNQFGNNDGNFDQYSTIKNSQFGNSGANFDQNSFVGNQANRYPSSASLRSNQPPSYAAGVKGLSHYSQPVSNLNTQPLKNSRPVALQPAHLQRKPNSFLQEPKNPNFRPSFFLGSQVLTSTPEYSQPTLNSLGTTNQYIPPTQPIPEHLIAQPISEQYGQPIVGQYVQAVPAQYTAPQSLGELPLTQREYLPPSSPNFVNSYQASGQSGYGLPETIIYTKSSLYGERYGQAP
ncbi:uncharacterized protein LOC129576733 [Sitodiplosis mosellana]|uniref:uncharacterized protein LOC129576733 n=1 Tax=Sitodiplosis mosellana TaxID=263140 RepID=UPI002443D68B|nr:uncharacterized protein LOC129576733 [Sitodiplosis mosellana]